MNSPDMSSFIEDAIEAAPEGTLDPDEFSISTDYQESSAPEWCSLTSSVARHMYENGRRYHYYKSGRYPIPNDDQQQRVDEMQHLVNLELLGGEYFLSPIGPNPGRIIDLGCGIGSWVIEVGDKFPNAEVIGVDLSPIQPVWVPPNVRFVMEDIEGPWIYGSHFDLIRTWNTYTLQNPSLLVAKAYSNLRPGGWLEISSTMVSIRCDDDSLPEDYAPQRMFNFLQQSYREVFGFDMDFLNRRALELKKAGFQNVQETVLKAPLGPWAKDGRMRYLGFVLRQIALELIPAICAKPLVKLGICQSDINALAQEVEDALYDMRCHGYFEWVITYGQKPVEQPEVSASNE